MTEGMITVMNRIHELQKRFGLIKSEQAASTDVAGKAAANGLNFSQMLQEQQNTAQAAHDDSALPAVELNNTASEKPIKVLPSTADLRATAARASVYSPSSYDSKSVIDLIMQDKRGVSGAVEKYTQNTREVLQNSDEDTTE